MSASKIEIMKEKLESVVMDIMAKAIKIDDLKCEITPTIEEITERDLTVTISVVIHDPAPTPQATVVG